MAAPILIAVALLGPVVEAVSVERFVTELGRLRADVRTLRVAFTLECTDAVFRRTTRSAGTLTLAKENDTFFISLSVEPEGMPNDAEIWVLRGADLFLYSPSAKTITKFPSAKSGALKYVADYAWSAAWLLDPAEARKRCDIRLTKRDEHYDYFTVETKARAEREEYRFAVIRKGSKEFPAGVVRQVAHLLPDGSTEVFKVTSWVRDAGDVTAKDFPDPAKPPEGWKVVDVKAILNKLPKP